METSRKRIVIVGATSAIAEHCARLWVTKSPVDLVLLGRNKTKLQAVAQDLAVRNTESNIVTIETNFTDPTIIQNTVNSLFIDNKVDIVLIAHGTLPDQLLAQNDIELCQHTLNINGISPVLFAEAFANKMEQIGTGIIAIIGSVAGDRGRKSNYIYGAAKGLVTRYSEGLQHRFANTKIKIIVIKPGPTATPMTAHLKGSFTSVEEVALTIFKGIEHGKEIIYTPKKWALIMFIIKHIPDVIFRKINI